jgi:hypothetical protein
MSEASRLPPHLRAFVDREDWTFAKTMPLWPHEYLVRHRVDDQLFEELVRHVHKHGREGRFYNRLLIYFVEDGMQYWNMGEPAEESDILNRCPENESWENRLKAGTLPEDSEC